MEFWVGWEKPAKAAERDHQENCGTIGRLLYHQSRGDRVFWEGEGAKMSIKKRPTKHFMR
jgi:hypothetical protein